MDRIYNYDFRAAGYPLRLYSGKDALESLPTELKRHRGQRAFEVVGVVFRARLRRRRHFPFDQRGHAGIPLNRTISYAVFRPRKAGHGMI